MKTNYSIISGNLIDKSIFSRLIIILVNATPVKFTVRGEGVGIMISEIRLFGKKLSVLLAKTIPNKG